MICKGVKGQEKKYKFHQAIFEFFFWSSGFVYWERSNEGLGLCPPVGIQPVKCYWCKIHLREQSLC